MPEVISLSFKVFRKFVLMTTFLGIKTAYQILDLLKLIEFFDPIQLST